MADKSFDKSQLPAESFDAVLAEMRRGGGTETGWIGIDTARQWADRLQSAREAEVAELRETNRRMNRRVQVAEAAIPSYQKLIAIPPDGDGVRLASGNMGRALLTWHCAQLSDRADRAVGLLRECEDAVFGKELWERIRAFLSEQAGERENVT